MRCQECHYLPRIFFGIYRQGQNRRLRPQNQKECDRQWILLILREQPTLAQEMAVSRVVHCPHVKKTNWRWKVCSPPQTNGAWRPLIQTTKRKRTSTGDTSLPPDYFLVSVHCDTMPGPYAAANVPLHSVWAGTAPTLIPWFKEPASSCTLSDMSNNNQQT